MIPGLWVLLFGGFLMTVQAQEVPVTGDEPAAAETPLALVPADRLEQDWWKRRHEIKLRELQRDPVDLLFIGDSITHSFETGKGKALWDERYAPRGAVNLGFSGDRTEHVIWRLQNGQLEGVKPKLAVIMLGTNNTGHRMDPPGDIAAGIRRICELLRADSPETTVLLLAIFPRGANAEDKLRQNNEAANLLIAQLADEKHIFFADINEQFLEEDGTLPRTVMPDLLHPDEQGYRIWADALDPLIARWLTPRAPDAP